MGYLQYLKKMNDEEYNEKLHTIAKNIRNVALMMRLSKSNEPVIALLRSTQKMLDDLKDARDQFHL